MKKTLQNLSLFLVIFITSISAVAQNIITITDSDLENGTYNWSSDNIYMLKGTVYLEAGGVLNIEAGTVIKGKAGYAPASSLIISRGAKINANGTKTSPIIFTAEVDFTNFSDDLGFNQRGLWGGLIILGNARIAEDNGEDFVDGLPSTDSRNFYGGNDDSDSSGSLTYVSIRHGGDELAPDNEINGLTLGGVGNGTVIENIEVVSNLDDGIELFGGSVSIKNAIVAFCGDECFDYDESWNGNGQFWFAMVGTDIGDQPGEHDGSEATAGTEWDFREFPTIYNATYIGPGAKGTDADNVKCPRVFNFKSKGGGTYANSIFTDFAKDGIQVEDKPASEGYDSYQSFLDGNINLLNNIWYSGHWNTIDDVVVATPDAEDMGATALKNALVADGNTLENPQLGNIDRGSIQNLIEILGNGNLNPIPANGGAAYQNLASYEGLDSWFTEVHYKGAFGNENWALGWTAMDEYGFFEQVVGVQNISAINSLNVAPNPATNYTVVELNLDQNITATINLTDVNGKIIKSITTDIFSKGTNQLQIDTQDLSNGVYFVQVVNENHISSSKLIIAK